MLIKDGDRNNDTNQPPVGGMKMKKQIARVLSVVLALSLLLMILK